MLSTVSNTWCVANLWVHWSPEAVYCNSAQVKNYWMGLKQFIAKNHRICSAKKVKESVKLQLKDQRIITINGSLATSK